MKVGVNPSPLVGGGSGYPPPDRKEINEQENKSNVLLDDKVTLSGDAPMVGGGAGYPPPERR